MKTILNTIILFLTLNSFAHIDPIEVNRGEKLMEEIDSVKIHEPVPGQFTDNRDGKTYKIVTIGSQTWMAENLSFRPENGKYEENNIDTINSEGFGYYYEMQTALKVCPDGWKLPSKKDWSLLNNMIDSIAYFKSISGWKNFEETIYVTNGIDGFNDTNLMPGESIPVRTGKMLSGNGNNKLLFNAIPAGEWGLVINEYYPIHIRNTGLYAEWWTADVGFARLDVNSFIVRHLWNNDFYKNVRCIREEGKENIGLETNGEVEVFEETETKKESATKQDNSKEEVKEVIKNIRGIFRR